MNKDTEKTRIQILGTSIFLYLNNQEMQKWNPKSRKYFFIPLDNKEFFEKILKETELSREELNKIKNRYKDYGLENFELSAQNFKSFCGR